jgi:hypothetical protein
MVGAKREKEGAQGVISPKEFDQRGDAGAGAPVGVSVDFKSDSFHWRGSLG